MAWKNAIMLHELATQSASLEEAFVESTEGDIESGDRILSDRAAPEGER